MDHNRSATIVAPTPSLAQVTAVTKTYGIVQALTDVSFELAQGEVLGLIGENGAGKSTLIGVLSGSVQPDTGSIRIRGQQLPPGNTHAFAQHGVAVVTQEQALVPSLRVFENLLLNRELRRGPSPFLRRGEMRRQAADLLAECGLTDISPDTFVGNLRYPQRQLVEIAKAFAHARTTNAAPIILLDEPTSGLSEAEVDLLFRLVDQWRTKAGFIFVSHILRDVLRIADRLLVLKDGRIVTTTPNNGLTDNDLHQLMVGRSRSLDFYHQADHAEPPDPLPTLELRHASDRASFTGANLSLHAGEIVGLAGVLGSGKSELAAAIAGANRLTAGELFYAGTTRRRWDISRAIRASVLYIPPERATDSVFTNNSVTRNISIAILDHLRNPLTRLLKLRAEKAVTHRLAAQIAIKAASLRTPLGELSGGNQQKAVFARWLDRTCRVLVLDDPTRGIDVGTREDIYAQIRSYAARRAAVVLCSESLEELIGLADRIIVLKDGRIVAEVPAPPGAKPSEYDVVRHMV
jgi:ribose transport system ATP-binding protein